MARSMQTIIILILLIVVFISLWVFIGKVGQEAKYATDAGTCLVSIQNANLAKKMPHPVKGEPFFALNCPREEVTIKKQDIVAGNKVNQLKAHSIIANEMKTCWDKVGAGKIDPFSDWNEIEDRSICLICSRIHYDESLITFMKKSSKQNKPLQEFTITNPLPYLQERHIPKGNISYFKYFYGTDPKTGLTEKDRAKLQTSIVDDNTLILVRMYKPSERSLFWPVVGVVTAGVLIVGGIVLSPFTGGASLALVGVGIKVATVVTAGMVVAGVTAAVIAVPDAMSNAFGDCPDCNGVGGLVMVPSTVNLYEENIPYKDEDGKTEMKALCDILAN